MSWWWQWFSDVTRSYVNICLMEMALMFAEKIVVDLNRTKKSVRSCNSGKSLRDRCLGRGRWWYCQFNELGKVNISWQPSWEITSNFVHLLIRHKESESNERRNEQKRQKVVDFWFYYYFDIHSVFILSFIH